MRALTVQFLLTISALTIYAAEMGRVDPHGPADKPFRTLGTMKDNRQCTICHDPGEGPIRLRLDYDEKICSNCHNKTPHSGSADHLGKKWLNPKTKTEEPLVCLTCHSPHRSEQKDWTMPSGFFKRKKESVGPFIFDSIKHPMLNRVCVDCHKW